LEDRVVAADDDQPDRPRRFRDESVVSARAQHLNDPHVSPLNNWVRDLRTRLGHNVIVPWFDPSDGGVDARILWLLEAPGPKATRERGGSGFVSCDNNDRTAENTWTTRQEAEVPRALVAHWNVIPYYIGTNDGIRAHTAADIAACGPLLTELLGFFPSLRAVILGGNAAQQTWNRHAPTGLAVRVIASPHPSPTNLNTRPEQRPLIVSAWQSALAVAVA
jgi:uracil-DNA glycosylase